MKIINLFMIIVIIPIIILGFVFINNKSAGDAIREDIFKGTITNMQLSSLTLKGTGVYDRSCNPVENGLTQCDAGIQTEKGLLNFNYEHNMHMQRCINSGDNLEVEILENNRAIVRRI